MAGGAEVGRGAGLECSEEGVSRGERRNAAGLKTAGATGAAPRRGAAPGATCGLSSLEAGRATGGSDGDRLRQAGRDEAGEGERLRPPPAQCGTATGGGET